MDARNRSEWEESPYVLDNSLAQNRQMSMYVEVLTGAMDSWDTELSGDALLDYVLSCRAALPERELGAGVWSEATLVAEVAYDRALISIAVEYGVDVTPTNFVHPRIERERLEAALEKRGLDLRSPHSRSRDLHGASGET